MPILRRIGPKEIVMMHIGNTPDVEQLIKDARYARMKFVRKNLRFFVYGSGVVGLFCAFVMTVLAVGSAKQYQQATQISHVAKTLGKPVNTVH